MGARGPLRLAHSTTSVADATKGTAAANVPAVAPLKPDSVAADPKLSRAWDDIVPQLDAAGLVSPADAAAVEICLRHFILARKAYDAIDGDVVVDDPAHGGVKKNPAEAVFRLESDAFLKYAKDLGLTFVSRARVAAAAEGESRDNPFSDFG